MYTITCVVLKLSQYCICCLKHAYSGYVFDTQCMRNTTWILYTAVTRTISYIIIHVHTPCLVHIISWVLVWYECVRLLPQHIKNFVFVMINTIEFVNQALSAVRVAVCSWLCVLPNESAMWMSLSIKHLSLTFLLMQSKLLRTNRSKLACCLVLWFACRQRYWQYLHVVSPSIPSDPSIPSEPVDT